MNDDRSTVNNKNAFLRYCEKGKKEWESEQNNQ